MFKRILSNIQKWKLETTFTVVFAQSSNQIHPLCKPDELSLQVNNQIDR